MNKDLENLQTNINQLHAILEQEIDLSTMTLKEMEELTPTLSELCTHVLNLRTALIMAFVTKQLCSSIPAYIPQTSEETP